MDDFNLTAEKIYNQNFGVEFKGYSASEVDKYLDLIIQDYQKYEKLIELDKQTIMTLEQKNAQLKSYIIELEGKLKAKNEEAGSVSSSDILKRLSRLEEIVNSK